MLVLTTITNVYTTVSFNYFWNIIGIATLAGLTFGVVYPYLWKQSTLATPVKIIIATALNVTVQFLAVSLYSGDMFQVIKPYMVGIILLTLVGHIIAFYFYKKTLK